MTQSYYNAEGIDPLTILPWLYKLNNITDPYEAFLYGNLLKYIWRYKAKGNPIEDLEKALDYLKRLNEYCLPNQNLYNIVKPIY